jgi:hypothetical protein
MGPPLVHHWLPLNEFHRHRPFWQRIIFLSAPAAILLSESVKFAFQKNMLAWLSDAF